ncbi:MAG: L,D-transpeptidase [Acidimicrobiales bacterium]
MAAGAGSRAAQRDRSLDRAEDATITSHRFRALVDLSARKVTVWDGEQVVVESPAVIGGKSTPTPPGRFFVNDVIDKPEGSVYGPHILSLSGFSEAMETFAGGVPVIAIHGTNHPELMGSASSNGCVRVPNEIVDHLADLVPIGTPVDIVA